MKDITLTLHKGEILYEVQNKAYILGKNRSTGNNFEQVSNIQNTGEEGDLDMMLRAMDTAYTEVKRNLARYINESKSTATNDIMDKEGDLVIVLKHYDMFNEASTETLKNGAHDYIVAHILKEWFKVVLPAEAEAFNVAKQEANISMLDALHTKTAPKREEAGE